MVAIKFLGIIVTFYLFVEAFGQNFYPARYGKREENDSYRDKNLSENRRIGRSENQDVLNRKMGFFISGGRFGKRGSSENCLEGDLRTGFYYHFKNIQVGVVNYVPRHEIQANYKTGSKEEINSGYQNRQDRSERIRIPIRKNQFMMGSRFGKRMDGLNGVTDSAENPSTQNLKCIFVGINGFYRCLERKQFGDEGDAPEFNLNSEFQ